MDSKVNTAVEGLQAQGSPVLSRSGRVRRKSSKFSDFESSDDIDLKDKKKFPQKQISSSPSKMDFDAELSDFDDIDMKDDDDWDLPDDDSSFMDVKLSEDDFKADPDLDSLTRDLDFDIGVDDESLEDSSSVGMAQSLYFSEKKGKKGKDGSDKRREAQRKDKGKTRFTAYMLWARETRPSIIEKNPELDFSTVNKRLGEMWQNVPMAQKYHWKGRAKRIAVRLRQSGVINTNRNKQTAANSKSSSGINSGVKSPSKSSSGTKPAASKSTSKSSVSPSKQTPVKGAAGRQSTKKSTNKSPKSPPKNKTGQQFGPRGEPLSPLKLTGTSAIDVAAHMKLLGESLNNISHKLKEHEGQIAVSGSLSVLLDSMLCILGPLMCLTDQVAETRGAIPADTHAAILDNIAYIMPGIV